LAFSGFSRAFFSSVRYIFVGFGHIPLRALIPNTISMPLASRLVYLTALSLTAFSLYLSTRLPRRSAQIVGTLYRPRHSARCLHYRHVSPLITQTRYSWRHVYINTAFNAVSSIIHKISLQFFKNITLHGYGWVSKFTHTCEMSASLSRYLKDHCQTHRFKAFQK
jgi:hypothetical protein